MLASRKWVVLRVLERLARLLISSECGGVRITVARLATNDSYREKEL
jgi:hypothetical protein